MRNLLLTEEAQVLQRTMTDLYDQLQRAHTAYQRCIAAAAAGADVDSETKLVLRREGRVYAELVVRYSNAAMAWLVFVENQMRPEQSHNTGL